jgi:hypothetical protein
MGTGRRRNLAALFTAATVLALVSPARGDKLVVVLPGQTLQPGVGLVGTPDPIVVRTPFTVAVFAVDDSYLPLPSYEGRIVIPVVPAGMPTVGPPLARRFGTLVSGIEAATSLPAGGSLRIAFGGGPLQVVTLAPAATPEQVCASIENAVHALPVESFAFGPLDFHCAASVSPLGVRYTLFLDDGTPVRAVMAARKIASGGSWIAIDPSYGSASALHLGAPEPSSDPSQPAEYYEPRPGPVTVADQRFSRGIAFFETVVTSMDAVGPNRAVGVDQGGPGGLPVESTTVTILPPSLHVVEATARSRDADGRIDIVRLIFSEEIQLASAPDPGHFSLQVVGQAPISGTAIQILTAGDLGYASSDIEVRFGAGLGKTDLQDVEVRYTPPPGSSLTGAETGTSLSSLTLSRTTSPPLVDGAPPVLVNAFAQDIDGNGGLDRMVFVFSEPVGFSSARGTSVSGFIPATDTTAFSVPVPFDLTLSTVGFATQDLTVTVTDPANPAATSITGTQAIADAITQAVRHDPLRRPAYLNFTCTFTSGRYVLRAGVPLRMSGGNYVQDSSVPGGGPPPALRLGPANGGVERPGSGNALTALPASLLVVRSQGGVNLLLGKTASDMTITGPTVTVNLTNVPNSGTAQPTYVWRDGGDLGFLTDRAPVPNLAAGFNNAGLPPEFHPVTMLREASASSSSAGLGMVRTAVVGDVILDGSPSVLPLNAQSPETVSSFTWQQVSGPPVPITPLAPGVAKVRPTEVVDTYVFTLTSTFETLYSLTDPPFNPYTEADGSLTRTLTLTVLPGPQGRTIVLLPGQTLVPGTESTHEVVGGVAEVATEGSEYHVRVVTTDDFFNPVPAPPGALVRLTTSDPGDIEPPFQPFTGGESDFTITPSHAATLTPPDIDDEVVLAFEHGDIHHPYIVGALWNVHPLPPLPAEPALARFSWTPDPRAVRWNIYRTSLAALADLDGNGLPDLGYGECADDPDPMDTYFEDPTMPPPGGGFMYAGTETLATFGAIQEAGLGRTRSGLERPNVTPCP